MLYLPLCTVYHIFFLQAFQWCNNVDRGLILFSINVKITKSRTGNWQDASLWSCLTNYKIFYFQSQMHLSTCLTYIFSLSIIFLFFIMYNPVIVIGTNYFILWNYGHIKILFMLKGSNSSLPWRDPDGKLTDQSWSWISC